MIFFKTATIHDIPSLVQLINSAYRGDSSNAGWTTESSLLDGQRTDNESLTQLIEEPFNQIEMAFDGETLIGCVHIKKENAETLYFGMLTVSPTLQSKGLGKKLIEHVEELARKEKRKRIRISVIQYRKELIAFYERRGFKATGNFEKFPSHDPKFGIPKVDNLELHEFIKEL